MNAPDRETLNRIEKGLRLLTAPLPHLAGLAAAVRVHLDSRVPTMGVFASGRLLVNPSFAARLKDNELVFVLAHELLHLALRTHERARGSDRLEFNYAHDYIINDILRVELGFATIPAGGLDMPGARKKSAEQIVLEMRRNSDLMSSRTQVWEGTVVTVRAVFGGGDGRPERSETSGDVLADVQERDWFPGESGDQSDQKEAMAELAERGLALASATSRNTMRGDQPAGTSRIMSARQVRAHSSWQLALQKWIESCAPGERSFTRPSRRGAERVDIALPGRKRVSWMLNIVLDTSGSMTADIPLALGAISDFCEAGGIDQVRLVQCDVAVTADETVTPDVLANFRIKGFGGSDLSPALLCLAEDPQVTAAIVITDGEIAFPQSAMPYRVLWVLPARSASQFHPPYGQIIVIDGERP